MKVCYINLDRRPDRRKALVQNLYEMDVPPHKIFRCTATDRDMYETPAQMVQAAAAMGYPEFQINLYEKTHLKYLGYMISLFRALDWAADQKENVLIMEDDYRLIEPYHTICHSLGELINPINVAMLGWNKNAKDVRECLGLSQQSIWQYGTPSNGNQGNVYSPEGAQFILDTCKAGLPTTPEVVIKELDISTPRCYSRKLEHICIKSTPFTKTSDVMNEEGADFEKLI